jgi:diguanylate cyclase (GGDEF)-like protein
LERFIAILSPRNRIDFVGKAILLCLLLGAMNYLRDYLSYGPDRDDFFNNLLEASFVGVPFVILALASIEHMAKLQNKLARLAATDMLTGLPNRRAFMEAVETSDVKQCSDVVMMIDVDHFKRINDTFGHAIGDISLQHLAACFRQQIRKTDVVARMGGEEFAVLLQGTTIEEARPIAQRITRGGRFKVSAIRDEVRVTTSVGVAERHGDVSIDKILHRADEALYRAKSEGRACFRIADDIAEPSRDDAIVA